MAAAAVFSAAAPVVAAAVVATAVVVGGRLASEVASVEVAAQPFYGKGATTTSATTRAPV